MNTASLFNDSNKLFKSYELVPAIDFSKLPKKKNDLWPTFQKFWRLFGIDIIA